MEDFFPDQLYVSSGEPELGLGIVTEISKGRVKIFFPTADETRLYATESAPIKRVVFKIGDSVMDRKGATMVIEKIQIQNANYIYFSKERKLHENEILSGSTSHGVEDRLFMGDVDSPELFALRRETLYHNYQRRISPVHGFLGGKIDLIPHQLYIAHEISSRFAPRVLLSDQVGLGKTIEACLILHRLLVTGRISRVLILVPDSLVHQWFVEVLRKFNLWFHIFDEERCASLEDNAPDGNPFLDDQLIICSIDFLAGSPKRTAQAIAADWDMLVVDEAHHLEWSVDQVSPEYAIVEALSQISKGLLLLTATPEQLGAESHFARLRLLDPNRYHDYQDFIQASADSKPIANLVENLTSGNSLKPDDKKYLESIFSKERIAALSKKDDQSQHHLIEDLLDLYGPGRVLFRNTRLGMSGFPKRIAHFIPLEDRDKHEFWIERAKQEFLLDLKAHSDRSETQDFEYDFDKDPRLQWILDLMESLYPEKILLICNSKEKVLALEASISKAIGRNVGVFHEDLTLVQRDRNAAWFAEHESAQILLCSEIGSEGRNFQFAHNLVLFDIPLHPEVLEQRIGRLDRIGQKNDIQIHIPYLVGSPQNLLVDWYHKGLDAFESNLEDGNLISKLFGKRLLEVVEKHAKNASVVLLESLIMETASFHKSLKKDLAEGRDRLLEMNSFRPKIAEKLIRYIQSEDKDATLENYLTEVLDHFNMEMEDLAPRTYFLRPGSFNSEIFPAIPQEGLQVTFDRKRALKREDVTFLSWDHPIITGAIDMVLSSSLGIASSGVLKNMGSPGLLMELIFVLETAGKKSIAIDRFLPHTPLRIIVDHSGKDRTDNYSIEMLNKNILPSNIDALLENETLATIILPKMLASGSKIAKELGDREIRKGLKRMFIKLDHEIARLEHLKTQNKDIRPEEIEIALEERATLTTVIESARIRLDAIQLIRQE